MSRKNKYPTNEKSFFATSESVGCFWRAATKARRRAEIANRKAAINKESSMAGKIVVIPAKRPEESILPLPSTDPGFAGKDRAHEDDSDQGHDGKYV